MCHSGIDRCNTRSGTGSQTAIHKRAISVATDYEVMPKRSTLTESASAAYKMNINIDDLALFPIQSDDNRLHDPRWKDDESVSMERRRNLDCVRNSNLDE